MQFENVIVFHLLLYETAATGRYKLQSSSS